MSIFEQATRKKLRFPTSRGDVTVEDLWDIPLQSVKGFDLDTIAKTINNELKKQTEESFVKTGSNPAAALLSLRLEVVKHVISVKLDEAEKARLRAARAAEREKLVAILADQQEQALKEMTPEQIQARLKELEE